MNGRIAPPVPDAGADLRQSASWYRDPDLESIRLAAALALSCLLHATLVFLPFLGQSVKETRLAQKGSQKIPHVLNATLAMAGESKYFPESAPPAAPVEPKAPAVARPAEQEQPKSQIGTEGADLLPLPALGYYPTDQLTLRPQPVTTINLDPPEVGPIVASGKLVLRLWISEFGNIVDVNVEKSDVPEVFARTAVAAFKGLHFTPGQRNGVPVGTVMLIEVSYDDGRLLNQ